MVDVMVCLVDGCISIQGVPMKHCATPILGRVQSQSPYLKYTQHGPIN
jgi:hypothetical protein